MWNFSVFVRSREASGLQGIQKKHVYLLWLYIPGDPNGRFFWSNGFDQKKMVIRFFSAFFQHLIEKIRLSYGQIRSMIKKNTAIRPNTGKYGHLTKKNGRSGFQVVHVSST